MSRCQSDLYVDGSFAECTLGAGHDEHHFDEMSRVQWSDVELPDYTYEQGRIDERRRPGSRCTDAGHFVPFGEDRCDCGIERICLP